MEQMLSDLRKRYESDLSKLLQQEQGLRKQLEDVVSRIFSFRGAVEAIKTAESQIPAKDVAALPINIPSNSQGEPNGNI